MNSKNLDCDWSSMHQQLSYMYAWNSWCPITKVSCLWHLMGTTRAQPCHLSIIMVAAHKILCTCPLTSCFFISLLLSIVSEVPVQEDTLMRTIIIGLSNELPLTAPETLEIADSLVRRVAAVKVPSAWMQGLQSGLYIC